MKKPLLIAVISVALVALATFGFIQLNKGGTFLSFRNTAPKPSSTPIASSGDIVPLQQTQLLTAEPRNQNNDGTGLCLKYLEDQQNMFAEQGTFQACPNGPLTPPPYNYQLFFDQCDWFGIGATPNCECRGGVPIYDLYPYCAEV